MVDVRAVIESRQIADQSQAPDGTPTHVLDQSVIHFRQGSNHHGATGELGVAEGDEQEVPTIDFILAIDLQGKGTPPEPRQADEDRRLIANLSPTTETAGGQRHAPPK